MKKILLGIFIAAVLFVSIWGINYVMSPVNSVDISLETVENSVNDPNGIIIRDEEIYYSQVNGTVYNHVSEGDRVGKNFLISTVFSGQISDDNLNELRTIDKKIEHRSEKLKESTIYSSGGIDVESKIAAIIRDITPAGEDNDVMKIADYKEDLNNLRNGVDISDEDILNSLKLEKEAIENRISTNRHEITTNMSGIFTTYIDGLEEALSPENMENYTVEYLQNLGSVQSRRLTQKSVEEGGAVCKVVNNHIWYTAMSIPTQVADSHETGEKVTLKFNSIADSFVEGEIYRIGDTDENGQKIIIIRCPSYFEGAVSFRNADIDLIFESYTGYKIPVYAIRSDNEGKQYVLALSEGKEYTCYCDIVYTDAQNEFVIIESSQNAQYEIKNMEKIIVGER